MSDFKKQGDSERALARLLAEALRPPDGAAHDETCPDAGLLAAYADHNLDAAETARWEEHFAGCGRCQKILAVLTVSSEEPSSEAEVDRFGHLVAAWGRAAAGAEPRAVAETKTITPFARPRTAWRWLAPAVGIAAAAALWIALRPAPPRGAPAITAQKTIAQPSAAPDESLEAKADVPAPPAAAAREAEPSPPRQEQLKSLAQPQKKESDQAANVRQAPQQPAAQARGAAAAPEAGDLQTAASPSAAGRRFSGGTGDPSRRQPGTVAPPALRLRSDSRATGRRRRSQPKIARSRLSPPAGSHKALLAVRQ